MVSRAVQFRFTLVLTLLNALNGVVDIDDDNKPAPENIPSPQDNASQHNSILSGDWGHDGICFQ